VFMLICLALFCKRMVIKEWQLGTFDFCYLGFLIVLSIIICYNIYRAIVAVEQKED